MPAPESWSWASVPNPAFGDLRSAAWMQLGWEHLRHRHRQKLSYKEGLFLPGELGRIYQHRAGLASRAKGKLKQRGGVTCPRPPSGLAMELVPSAL